MGREATPSPPLPRGRLSGTSRRSSAMSPLTSSRRWRPLPPLPPWRRPTSFPTAMVSEVDTDGDGEINLEEFLLMMAKKENDNDEIRAAFEIFDKDHDGFISPTELRTVMESLGEVLSEEDIDVMMKGADQNGDGQV